MKKILLTVSLVLALPLVAHAEDIYSEVVSYGEYGQGSTITGKGEQGQGTYTTDHPRFPGADSSGHVYFLDGSQKTAKLRMWNGNKNQTIQ